MRPLTTKFFDRPTVEVAKDMIGCYLVRRVGRKTERHMITETEAYDGPLDLACHASKGRTRRTEVLFGPPGRLYIYFTYGMHWLLNFVAGPEGYPAGVLVRGIEGLNGPARVTKKLGIDGSIHGQKACRKTGLWVEPRRRNISEKMIRKTARIGVDYAGPVWSKKKYRFILK